MTQPCGGDWRLSFQFWGKGRRGGAFSILAAARRRLAVMNFAERDCRARREAWVKRDQTLACQRPLKFSMAAWKPVSRGGAKTGIRFKERQRRMTRPRESGCWWAPWKTVSLSNWT